MATAVYNPTPQINQLNAANKAAANLGLLTARNKSLDTLSTAQKAIEPAYLKSRSQVDTTNQQAARNFAEFMAQRGQNNAVGNSGSLAQANITNNAFRQGSLGNLANSEATANSQNAKQVADVNTGYNSGVASSNANIDAATMQSLITAQQNYNASLIAQENANRAFAAQQQQQAADNAYRQQQAAQAQANVNASRSAAASASRSAGSAASSASSKADNINQTAKSITDAVYGFNTNAKAAAYLSSNKAAIIGAMEQAGMTPQATQAWVSNMQQDLAPAKSTSSSANTMSGVTF
jgi:hypothetical protein